MKIFQTLGKASAFPGTFGIEIEAEGQDMHQVNNKFWGTEDDGSLRGHYPESRAEFVLKKPIERDQVVPALNSLVKALDGAKFDFSYRTSVHVHLNVQDLTHTQMLNVVYTYLLLEEPLINFCGKSRKANRFCLRLVDAEGVLNVMKVLFKNGPDSILAFNGDQVRYCAINLAALQKYGSLEFRAMRGNMDVDTIKTWTEALFFLREFAKSMESPRHILALFEKLGPKAFMEKVLDEASPAFSYPRMVKEMQRSFSLSLDLPYSFVDQQAAPKVVAPKKPKIGDVLMHPLPMNNPAGEVPVGNWAMPQAIEPEGHNAALAQFRAHLQAQAEARAAIPRAPAPVRRPAAPRVIRDFE